jgi:hypothetical protein
VREIILLYKTNIVELEEEKAVVTGSGDEGHRYISKLSAKAPPSYQSFRYAGL